MNTLEQLIYDLLGSYGIFLIPVISGIATSFFTEFIDYLTPKKITSIPILLSVGAVFTVLTMGVFPIYFPQLIAFDTVFWYLLNIAIAVLFYKGLGKWTVKLFFEKLKSKIDKTTDL